MTLAPLLAVLLTACEAEDPRLAESTCEPAILEMQAKRHGFQLVFEPCGGNALADAAWAPGGHDVYYALELTQHVLHLEEARRTLRVVQTPSPTGPATWASPTVLVHPIGPEAPDGPARLAIFDTAHPPSSDPAAPYVGERVSLPAGFTGAADLGRSRDPGRIYLTGRQGDGPRRVWEVELATGATTPAFPFTGDVDAFTFTPAADRVVTTKNGAATVWDAATGAVVATFQPALRGVVHPTGKWMVLEHEGPPVSIFGPDNPRGPALEAALPPNAERTHRPPMLSLVDLATLRRYELTTIHGSQFEWYELTDFYGSFVLWGFDRATARRNVMLGNFLERMTGAEIGALPLGMREVGEKEGFLAGRPEAPPAAP